MTEKTNRFLYFLLGLLTTDLLYSLYFYLKKEIVKINNYIIQPEFFLTLVFVDIIVIAVVFKMAKNKK